LPPCEAVLDPVPVADLVLAELPAEKNGLAVPERGEVDQPLVEILHLCSMRVDLVDGLCERARDAVELGSGVRERGGRDAAAVAANPPLELLLPLERVDVLAPLLDHSLDQRPDVVERGV